MYAGMCCPVLHQKSQSTCHGAIRHCNRLGGAENSDVMVLSDTNRLEGAENSGEVEQHCYLTSACLTMSGLFLCLCMVGYFALPASRLTVAAACLFMSQSALKTNGTK